MDDNSTSTAKPVSALSESLKKSDYKTFCSFFIADFEVALSMEVVQEIVNYPEIVTPVPMTPSYCEGIFNLRGMIIPLIHLCDLLGEKRPEKSVDQKVAITHYHDIKIGLLVDATNEIFKVSSFENEDVVYQENSANPIVKGILKLNDGKRLLHVLDPEGLIKLEDIPHVVSKARATGEKGHLKKTEKKTKGITFQVGETSMFLHMSDIFEIIQVEKFERCFVNYPYTKGLVNLRGMMIPVIELREFLKGGSSEKSQGRVIILTLPEGNKLGLSVDSVDGIIAYGEGDVLTTPSMFQEDLYQGYLSGSHVMIDPKYFMAHKEIAHVIEGHKKLALGTSEADKKVKRSGKETFISFKMNGEYCFPILDIQEIILMPEDYTKLPQSSSQLLGIYNLRGKPVTLVNLQKTDSPLSKVVILKNEDQYVGLVVESVEDIFSIYSQDKFPCPPMFKNETEKRLTRAVKEIVLVNDGVNKNRKLAVFDLKEFFNPALYAA